MIGAAFLLLATACGDDDDAAADDEMSEDEMSEDAMDDMAMEDGMDMDEMNMGDPDATPAAETDYDSLAAGTFELLETRPENHDDVAGTVEMARHADGTTVTVELTGLVGGEDYISHVHDGPCSESGGDHYKFDPNGSDLPPNEIHLAFTAGDDGSGFMTAENHEVAGDDAISLVVHPAELLDNKIACAEFEVA